MASLVVDATVTLTWCFKDETTVGTARLLQRLGRESMAVPAVWPLEIANALVQGTRRGRVSDAQSRDFVSLLKGLDVDIDQESHAHAWGGVMELARTHGLSAYDAAYLELALRRTLPLATFDGAIIRAAPKVGVALEPL